MRRRAGKTHLAIAIARSCIRSGSRGRYFTTVDLVNRLEAEARAGPPGAHRRLSHAHGLRRPRCDKGVTFRWKDYRTKGRDRLRTVTLDAAEFIRRFLLHVLPSGFHRIRHYGLFAGAVRARNIERARQLLAAPKASPAPAETDSEAETPSPSPPCPCCGGRMIIVETFQGARPERSPSPTRIRIDSS